MSEKLKTIEKLIKLNKNIKSNKKEIRNLLFNSLWIFDDKFTSFQPIMNNTFSSFIAKKDSNYLCVDFPALYDFNYTCNRKTFELFADYLTEMIEFNLLLSKKENCWYYLLLKLDKDEENKILLLNFKKYKSKLGYYYFVNNKTKNRLIVINVKDLLNEAKYRIKNNKYINEDKYINALLYFATDGIDRTKLNIFFYYLDFICYKENGRSVTNDIYICKDTPVPSKLEAYIQKAKENGLIRYCNDVYTSFVKPNGEVFNKKEQQLLKNIKRKFTEYSNKELLLRIHLEAPWSFTKEGKEIEYKWAHDIDSI